MGYYTRAELVTQLEEIETAISSTLTSQSYRIGDKGKTNPELTALYKQRREILNQIEALDAASTGGMFNKVQFKRPS